MIIAHLNKDQVIGMLFDPAFDSGGDSDIGDDLAFPLPMPEDENCSPSPQVMPQETEAEEETQVTTESESGEGEGEREGEVDRLLGNVHLYAKVKLTS